MTTFFTLQILYINTDSYPYCSKLISKNNCDISRNVSGMRRCFQNVKNASGMRTFGMRTFAPADPRVAAAANARIPEAYIQTEIYDYNYFLP